MVTRLVFAIKSKDVCGDLLPRTRWDLVGHQCLLCMCSAVKFSTCFTRRDVLLHFYRHAWPVDTFMCMPQTCFYPEVGRVNLQLFFLCITTEFPLKTNPCCTVSSSRMLKQGCVSARACSFSGHPRRLVFDNSRSHWSFRVSALISSRCWSDMGR